MRALMALVVEGLVAIRPLDQAPQQIQEWVASNMAAEPEPQEAEAAAEAV
jgi:hypothetical protein